MEKKENEKMNAIEKEKQKLKLPGVVCFGASVPLIAEYCATGGVALGAVFFLKKKDKVKKKKNK